MQSERSELERLGRKGKTREVSFNSYRTKKKKQHPMQKPRLSRRQFIKTIAVGGIGVTSIAAISHQGIIKDTSADITLEHRRIEFKDLPKDLDGFRIGFISDIHLGIYLPDEWLAHSFDLLREEKPDLLCLGGDYIWVHESGSHRWFGGVRNHKFLKPLTHSLAMDIFSVVSKLSATLDAPFGTYGVLGNHDHWTDGELCKRCFEDRNIQILMNQDVILRRGTSTLRMVGIDDYWTGNPAIPQPNPMLDRQPDFTLLLLHNPDYLGHILSSGFKFDLALAGHTHAGQVKLPLLGAVKYNIEDARFEEGLYQTPDFASYTTRGLGVVEIPWRINCPPEVSILELNRI